jgi:hypothetical protein
MPKTVVSIKATMRDHTIGVPAPENTVAFGIPNACTECHTDKQAAWAVSTLQQWWPRGRRAKMVARAEAFTAARANRPEALDRLTAIVADERQGPLVQANAAGYLGRYADLRATTALLAAAKASHPAIRSAAISSLGLQLAAETAQPRKALLAALSDPQSVVRTAAIVSLINSRGARFRFVGAEFAARARLHEDDAVVQRDLGLVQLLSDRFDPAADALQISIGLQPDQPSVKFLLALARLGQRRVDEARTLLKQVPPADPYFKLAQERLKQLEPLQR